MQYPEILLPHPNKKLITCSLASYHLTRSTKSKDIIDDLNQVKLEAIVSPKEHILDLSINLLGKFEFEHHYISLTEDGKSFYSIYCKCDEHVDSPIFNRHFINDSEKFWWTILINDIEHQNYICSYKNVDYTFRPIVSHTPMKWNFWHFSIKWQHDNNDLETWSKSQQNKFKSAISAEARSTIKQYAKIDLKGFPTLPDEEFLKNS